jgi:MSHA biogenesis protein MshQ
MAKQTSSTKIRFTRVLSSLVLFSILMSLIRFNIVFAEPLNNNVSGQCSGAFPNGAATHSAAGLIDFGYNAQLLGAANNILATATIISNGGSNKKTCQSSNCVASGGQSDVIYVSSFQTTNSATDVIINYQGSAVIGAASYPGNSFNDINPYYASEANISFSTNQTEYYVDTLILAFKNTLYLQAGSVYWINQLVTSSQSQIIVQGSGTAIVYVNQALAFPSPGLINSPAVNASGDASKLVLYAFNDVSFNNQTTFSGSLYSRGNISLGSASYAYGGISAANITLGTDSTINYQGSALTNTQYADLCSETTPSVDHFRIEHDGQGLTCEPKTLTIKACADTNCSNLYDQVTTLTLSPGIISGGNTLTFTGSTTVDVSITSVGNYTLSKALPSEQADLRCFVGATQSCDIAFVDAGFEFIGQTINDKVLPDQLAETAFNNVQLRAVQNDNGVCKVALTGNQSIIFGYDCDTPNVCLKPLAGIAINNASAENVDTLNLNFDSNGIASLSSLNYADAGRLKLSAQITLNNAQILKGSALVDVYPAYLQTQVLPISLISSGSADTGTFTAGQTFEFEIGAHGALGNVLPNYQAEQLKLEVQRLAPLEAGSSDGQFKYASAGFVNSSLNEGTLTSAGALTFAGGLYQYSGAYYSETGQIALDAQDQSYLGNAIPSAGKIKLDPFIPAYYQLSPELPLPVLENVQTNFTYIGQSNQFAHNPLIRMTAKNALDQTTANYDSVQWQLRPTFADVNNNDKLSFLDKSAYNGDVTVYKGTMPLISGDDNYDGVVLIELPNATITYNKVASDFSMFAAVDPFSASFDIVFHAVFFTDANGICWRDDALDATCNDFIFSDVSGADLRFGRFKLTSTYGPETEALTVGLSAQYYRAGRWLTNALDNATLIDFSEANGQLILTKRGGNSDADLTGLIDPISSDGVLLMGIPDSINDFYLSAPSQRGEVLLQMNPQTTPLLWPSYLNYDWNGDGLICNQTSDCGNSEKIDFPQAIISFGQFRANDRIIQWRELYN